MLAVSALGALFVVTIVSAAVGVIAWLLSGTGLEVGGPAVRASARRASGDAASGSGRPAPTPAATLERPGR